MWKEKPGVFRLVWDALFCALQIDNGLEAWLALTLYLCSKVACFPYTFKYLSKGESTSMSRMWKYISQFKLRENCNNGNIYQPTVVELLMRLSAF